jgi:hypothetical protein
MRPEQGQRPGLAARRAALGAALALHTQSGHAVAGEQ